jgi:hypothetical protein
MFRELALQVIELIRCAVRQAVQFIEILRLVLLDGETKPHENRLPLVHEEVRKVAVGVHVREERMVPDLLVLQLLLIH